VQATLLWHIIFGCFSLPGKMDFHKVYTKSYDWLMLYGPKVLVAIIVFLIGLWVVGFFKKLVRRSLAKKIANSNLTSFVVSVIVTATHILLVLLCLQIAGVELTLFAALVAAMGVAAGLALSGTLQNFTSGIIILILKPFKQGDIIIAQGQEGTIISIAIFYTLVRTYDNRTVIIPNSKLSNEAIINTSRLGSRRIDVELKFNYGMSFNDIRKIIEETISGNGNQNKVPKHRIVISSLDPDGYKVLINVWTDAHGYHDARYLLQEKVMQNLKGAGIKLPGIV
jgi:small conductance mechanosensitive channel